MSTKKTTLSGWKRHQRVLFSVAGVTFAEVLRDKVLYNTVVLSVLLFFVALLASRLAILHPGRMLIDFGISALLVSTSLTSILVSSGLITKEIVNRTMSVCLAHPIHRIQFLWGKFIGLALVLTLNWLILCLIFGCMVWLFGTVYISLSTFFWSLVLALFQCWLLGAMALFFSSFTTTSLAVICGLGLALIGSSMSQLRLLAGKVQNDFASGSLKFISWILPDVESFHLKLNLTYGLPVANTQMILLCLYTFLWVGLLVTLSGLLVRVRES